MLPLRRMQILRGMIFFVVLLCLWPSRDAAAAIDLDKKARSLAYYTMGVVFDLQGFTEQAIEQYEKSLEIKDNYAVHLRLGADYVRLGELEKAIEELNLVLEYDSHNVQARYLLALVYATRKDFDKAALEYESILPSLSKADPENVEIYSYLGQRYYSQKKYEKAITQYELILSLNQSDVDVLFLLGSLYLEVGNRSKAIELFSRAIMIDPENDNCLNSLGYTYAEDGVRLDEAQELIEKALSIDKDNGAYLDSLGWVYYQKKKYYKALEYFQKADYYLKDPVIYEHLGDVYYQLNKKEDARKYWELSLELLPEQFHVKEKINSLE